MSPPSSVSGSHQSRRQRRRNRRDKNQTANQDQSNANVANAIGGLGNRFYGSYPTLTPATSGAIASSISILTHQAIQELTLKKKGKYKISDYKEMITTDPVSKACVTLKQLRVQSSFGDYHHTDKAIQEWVRGNFEEMRGSLTQVVGDLSTAMPFGFAIAECVYSSKMPGHYGEWRLERFIPLDPEHVSFAGAKGELTHVIYNDNGVKKWIPYEKCLHIIGCRNFGKPDGLAEAEAAMPYYRAKQLLFAEMVVAGKNNATGILFGQADSNDTVRYVDPSGKPVLKSDGSEVTVSAVDNLNMQLQNLEGSGIITTDLKNRLTPLLIPSGDGFWQISLTLLAKQIMLAYQVPSLIFDEGTSGLGNAGLSGSHRSTLDSNIYSIVVSIQEEILEKVISRLIAWNKNIKRQWNRAKDYGEFKSQPSSDPNFEIARAGALLGAMTSSVIPASDIDAVNELRRALGVSAIDEQKMMDLIVQQAQQQQIQMQGQMPPEQAPADPGQGQEQQPAGFSYW
jgi:hypothetical protein